MKSNEEHAAEVLEALRRAVAEALERKMRLGQYAVFWQDGQTVQVGPEALAEILGFSAKPDAMPRCLECRSHWKEREGGIIL